MVAGLRWECPASGEGPEGAEPGAVGAGVGCEASGEPATAGASRDPSDVGVGCERTSGGLGPANASREPLGLGGGLLAGRGAEVQRSYVGSHDTAAGIPRRIASPQISERTFRSWGLSGWVAKNRTRSSSSSASKNGPLKDRRTSQDQKRGGFWEPLWELGTLELSDEWTVVLRLRDRRHEWEWLLARRTVRGHGHVPSDVNRPGFGDCSGYWVTTCQAACV